MPRKEETRRLASLKKWGAFSYLTVSIILWVARPVAGR